MKATMKSPSRRAPGVNEALQLAQATQDRHNAHASLQAATLTLEGEALMAEVTVAMQDLGIATSTLSNETMLMVILMLKLQRSAQPAQSAQPTQPTSDQSRKTQ